MTDRFALVDAYRYGNAAEKAEAMAALVDCHRAEIETERETTAPKGGHPVVVEG